MSDQKRGKIHQRERSTLFENSPRVHELVARAMRGKRVRQRTERKSVVLRSPQLHTTTRANTAHEKAEQIRARIVCTPAYMWMGGRESSACADGTIKISPHLAMFAPSPAPKFDPRGSP